MKRRQFITSIAKATAAAIMIGSTTVMVEGCTFDVKTALNTLLDSLNAILKVAEPNATWTSPLSNAIAALEQAESAWQSGSPAQVIVSALNTIEAVIAVIPVTASYAPLVDIIIAGIEAVMSALGLTFSLSGEDSRKRATVVNSPHFKATTIKTSALHPTWTGAYKHQWNSECNTLKMPQAKI